MIVNNSKPPEAVDLKKRLCLLCERYFDSLTKGNRICKRCKDTVDYRDLAYAEPYQRF